MTAAAAPPLQAQAYEGAQDRLRTRVHRAGPDMLYRPREGRMLAGVCAGFSQRYGWDVSIVRLVLVLGSVFGAGAPFLAYLVAWVVMPNGQYALPSQAGTRGPGSMRV